MEEPAGQIFVGLVFFSFFFFIKKRHNFILDALFRRIINNMDLTGVIRPVLSFTLRLRRRRQEKVKIHEPRETQVQAQGQSQFQSPSLQAKKQVGATASFSGLPVEIVLHIASYLPLLPKLCLALSSKSLRSVLNSQDTLERSPQFAYPSPLDIDGLFFSSDYWKLLLQLEDSRFRCCSGCLKMHPRSEFSEDDLRKNSELRTCNFGKLVGLVEPCPCTRLTIRDKAKLVKELKKSSDKKGNRFLDLDEDDDFTSCCRYTDGAMTIETKNRPKLGKGNNLIIESAYTITGVDIWSSLKYNKRRCCPHNSVFDAFIHALHTPCDWRDENGVLTFFRGSRKHLMCKYCWTMFIDPEWTVDWTTEKYTAFSLRTVRGFGRNNTLADGFWFQQSHRAHMRKPALNANESFRRKRRDAGFMSTTASIMDSWVKSPTSPGSEFNREVLWSRGRQLVYSSTRIPYFIPPMEPVLPEECNVMIPSKMGNKLRDLLSKAEKAVGDDLLVEHYSVLVASEEISSRSRQNGGLSGKFAWSDELDPSWAYESFGLDPSGQFFRGWTEEAVRENQRTNSTDSLLLKHY